MVPKTVMACSSLFTGYSLLIFCGVIDGDQINDLEQDIRSLEEKLCEISNEIMDAKLAIEQAKENYNALIFQRKSIHSKLMHIRTNLEYAKEGLL